MGHPKGLWYLSRYSLKMGKDFHRYGLKSGVVFEVARRAYKRIWLLNSR